MAEVSASVPIPDMAVVCPECELYIPVTVEAILRDGNLELDVSVADVWAHAFTHEVPTDSPPVRRACPVHHSTSCGCERLQEGP